MNAEVFTVCEAVTDSGGKLNLLGAFDVLYAPSLPFAVSNLSIAVRLRFERSEAGTHRMQIVVIDPQGTQIGAPFTHQFATSGSQNTDSVGLNFPLSLQQVTFKSFGTYRLELTIDDHVVSRCPLYVVPQCDMPLNEHCAELGGLLANFQSLEFILRVFLHKLPSARPLGYPHGTDIYSFPIGSTLPVNELTSYDSLGSLIKKYNAELNLRHPGLQIDPTLVDLRDALAHGRVSAPAGDNTLLRLLKFSKPDANGQVRVVFNSEMTRAWFKSQKRRILEAVERVQQAFHK